MKRERFLGISHVYLFCGFYGLVVLFTGSPVVALDLELDMNISGIHWTPDHIKREQKLQKFPLPHGEASDLEKEEAGDFYINTLLTNERRSYAFYGGYAQSRLKSSYTTKGMLIPLETEYKPTYKRYDGKIGWAYYFFPERFGVGIGFRRIDSMVEMDDFQPLSSVISVERELFSSSGPELNFRLLFGSSTTSSFGIGLTFFSLQGPYSSDRMNTYYEVDFFGGDSYKTISFTRTPTSAKVFRDGGELEFVYKSYFSDNFTFSAGVVYQYSNVKVVNYQSDTLSISSDPSMNDPGYNALSFVLNKFLDSLFMEPFYNKPFPDSLFRIYMGFGIKI